MIGLFHLVLAKPGLQRRRQISPPKARVSYLTLAPALGDAGQTCRGCDLRYQAAEASS